MWCIMHLCASCFVFWVPFDGTSHTQIPCNYHDSYTYYLCCPSIVRTDRIAWFSAREFTLECILLTNNIIAVVKLPVSYVLHVRSWIISKMREGVRGREIAWLVYRCRDTQMFNFLTAFAMRWDVIDDMEVIRFLSSSSFVLYTHHHQPPSAATASWFSSHEIANRKYTMHFVLAQISCGVRWMCASIWCVANAELLTLKPYLMI